MSKTFTFGGERRHENSRATALRRDAVLRVVTREAAREAQQALLEQRAAREMAAMLAYERGADAAAEAAFERHFIG